MPDLSKLEALLEEILDVVHGLDCNAEAPVASNRTPPVYDYDGDDVVQNVVDALRRAIRVNREGRKLTAKERNVCRQAIRDLKGEGFLILNTNGNDFLTQSGV